MRTKIKETPIQEKERLTFFNTATLFVRTDKKIQNYLSHIPQRHRQRVESFLYFYSNKITQSQTARDIGRQYLLNAGASRTEEKYIRAGLKKVFNYTPPRPGHSISYALKPSDTRTKKVIKPYAFNTIRTKTFDRVEIEKMNKLYLTEEGKQYIKDLRNQATFRALIDAYRLGGYVSERELKNLDNNLISVPKLLTRLRFANIWEMDPSEREKHLYVYINPHEGREHSTYSQTPKDIRKHLTNGGTLVKYDLRKAFPSILINVFTNQEHRLNVDQRTALNQLRNRVGARYKHQGKDFDAELITEAQRLKKAITNDLKELEEGAVLYHKAVNLKAKNRLPDQAIRASVKMGLMQWINEAPNTTMKARAISHKTGVPLTAEKYVSMYLAKRYPTFTALIREAKRTTYLSPEGVQNTKANLHYLLASIETKIIDEASKGLNYFLRIHDCIVIDQTEEVKTLENIQKIGYQFERQ